LGKCVLTGVVAKAFRGLVHDEGVNALKKIEGRIREMTTGCLRFGFVSL